MSLILFFSSAYQKDSLANLSRRLESNPHHRFPILSKSSLMRNSRGTMSQKLLSLSKHKQFMPYEMITSVEDLQTQIPSQSDFTSTLGIGRIMTDDEFAEFKICWNTLKEEKYGESMTLKDYLCFYNALDVVLLSEAHLAFRDLLYQQYKLSPDWYPTLPSFCYSAFTRMLQLSGQKVELIHSEEMSNFVLRAKRGGLCQILGPRLHGAPGSEELMKLIKPSFMRYAQDGGILPETCDEGGDATDINPSMKDAKACMQEGGYYPSTLSSTEMEQLTEGLGWKLLYIDANNCKLYHHHTPIKFPSKFFFPVYGSAMTLPLPVGDYEFLEDSSNEMEQLNRFFEEMEKSHVEKIPQPQWQQYFPEESRGYFLECDVFFPEERHHLMSNFPPCPVQTEITEDDVSSYFSQAWHAKHGEDCKMPASQKLCATLVDKKDVVLHSENALIYSRIGAKVVVKKVLAFRQERYN